MVAPACRPAQQHCAAEYQPRTERHHPHDGRSASPCAECRYFPEGARSRDGKLHDFKKTFAIVSREMGVQVVPVAIRGTYQSFAHGSRLPRPSKVTVEFLPPVSPQGLEYEEMADRVRLMILEKTGE
jgi:hypothetical protein